MCGARARVYVQVTSQRSVLFFWFGPGWAGAALRAGGREKERSKKRAPGEREREKKRRPAPSPPLPSPPRPLVRMRPRTRNDTHTHRAPPLSPPSPLSQTAYPPKVPPRPTISPTHAQAKSSPTKRAYMPASPDGRSARRAQVDRAMAHSALHRAAPSGTLRGEGRGVGECGKGVREERGRGWGGGRPIECGARFFFLGAECGRPHGPRPQYSCIGSPPACTLPAHGRAACLKPGVRPPRPHTHVKGAPSARRQRRRFFSRRHRRPLPLFLPNPPPLTAPGW